MRISDSNAREAKVMLGDTGTIRRVAAVAVVIESTEVAEWLVISIGSSGSEGIYQTAFTGPLAKERALEYAAEKYSGFRLA